MLLDNLNTGLASGVWMISLVNLRAPPQENNRYQALLTPLIQYTLLDYQTYGDLQANCVVPKMSTQQLLSDSTSHPKTIIELEKIEVKVVYHI